MLLFCLQMFFFSKLYTDSLHMLTGANDSQFHKICILHSHLFHNRLLLQGYQNHNYKLFQPLSSNWFHTEFDNCKKTELVSHLYSSHSDLTILNCLYIRFLIRQQLSPFLHLFHNWNLNGNLFLKNSDGQQSFVCSLNSNSLHRWIWCYIVLNFLVQSRCANLITNSGGGPAN